MGHDSITNKAMDPLYILGFRLVVIDNCVSDGAWQHYRKSH